MGLVNLAHRASGAAAVAVFSVGFFAVVLELVMLVRLWWNTYHPLPWHDEWNTILFLFHAQSTPFDLGQWVAPHNEHRLFVPRLVFAADYWWFGGLNIFTFAASAFLLASTAAIFAMQAWMIPTKWTLKLGVMVSLVATLFNGQQSSNFLWSFQVQWFATHFFVAASTAAVTFAARDFNQRRAQRVWLWLAIAALFALAANFSTASGNFAWIAIIVAATFLRSSLPPYTALILGGCALASIVIYASGLALSGIGSNSLGLIASSPNAAALFLISFFGGPFAPMGKLAAIGGGALFLCSIVFLSVRIGRRNPGALIGLEAFSFAILAFVFASGVATTVGRVGLGLDAALESRFGSVCGIGWAALLLLVAARLASADAIRDKPVNESEKPKGNSSYGLSTSRVASVLFVGMIVGLAGYFHPPYDYWPLPQIKSSAMSAILTRVDDEQPLRRVGFWNLGAETRNSILRFMSDNHRSIFRSVVASSLDKSVHTSFSGFGGSCIGAIDRIEIVESSNPATRGLRISGWAWDRTAQHGAETVVIVNESGLIIGVGYLANDRPDVMAWDITVSKLRTGWLGHARLVGTTLLAYSYSKADGRLCLVSGALPIPNTN